VASNSSQLRRFLPEGIGQPVSRLHYTVAKPKRHSPGLLWGRSPCLPQGMWLCCHLFL